jgi:hypothetical protein
VYQRSLSWMQRFLAMAESILKRVASSDFRSDPFPHVVVRNALDAEYYRSLMDAFPSIDIVNVEGRPLVNNNDCFMGAVDVVDNPNIAQIWRDFFAYHVSPAFFQEAISLVGGHLRQMYPNLESTIGNSLNDLTSVVADSGSEGDASVQCQFGMNSPVVKESSVRTAHVDKPEKLFNALLYCRAPDDPTPGGDLTLYKFKRKPAFYDKRTAMPTRLEEVISIPYEANTLVLFLNSPVSVHGVRPRPPTPHIRRYINFQVELSKKLFEVPRINPLLAYIERTLHI